VDKGGGLIKIFECSFEQKLTLFFGGVNQKLYIG
jgi:hypothetical protein